jgi:imidazolonepropionase
LILSDTFYSVNYCNKKIGVIPEIICAKGGVISYVAGLALMNILVRGARQLLTLRGSAGTRRGAELRELGLIHDGAVLIQNGVIQEAGPSRRVENLHAARGAEEINATGRVVMPGFVDSHTHLVSGPSWLDDYEARLTGHNAEFVNFSDLKATFRSIQTSSARRVEAGASATVAAMVRHGTTSMEAKTGFGGNASAEIKILRVLAKLDGRPLDVSATCLATHWGEPPDPAAYLEWFCSQFLPKAYRRKLAQFADIECDRQSFSAEEMRQYLQRAARLGFLLKVHAGQSAQAGCAGLATEFGAVSVDHLDRADEGELAMLAGSETIATLVPGSTFYLGIRSAPARELISRGAAVALASGFNPQTSPTCNMQMVVSLACSELRMTPAEAIVAATINGAHAIRRGARAGSLEPGKDADLLILNASDYREIPYHFGWNQVHLTMKRGVTIYREGAVYRAMVER